MTRLQMPLPTELANICHVYYLTNAFLSLSFLLSKMTPFLVDALYSSERRAIDTVKNIRAIANSKTTKNFFVFRDLMKSSFYLALSSYGRIEKRQIGFIT